MSTPSSRSIMERTPMLQLVIAPTAIIVVSLACFSVILPEVIDSINDTCNSEPLLKRILCFFSAFFVNCLSTQLNTAFIATFLSFVATLLTATYVESSRLFNQPSRIITTPAVTWLLVNVVTGALITPLLLIATIRRTKDGFSERRESETHPRLFRDIHFRTPKPSTIATNDYSNQRHLASISETYAIPIGVIFGYILPSIALLVSPSYAIVALWNLFPLLISLVRRIVLLSVHRPQNQETHHVEQNATSLYRLYTVPALLSVLAHVYVTLCWFSQSEAASSTPPALKLMLVNFWAIAATFIYWLLIESSWRVALAGVITALFLGPGAGLTLGWVVKDRSIILTVPDVPASDAASRDRMGEAEHLIRDPVPEETDRGQ